MKLQISVIGLFILTIIIFNSENNAQEKEPKVRISPKAETMQTVGNTDIRIIYSRPGVKGRTIWGGLVPYDAVWRAGANEATKFIFNTNVTINGKFLKAGSYSFFTIPGKKEWTIIFNKVANQWGAFEYNEAEDALRINVKPEKGSNVEWLLYSTNKISDTSAIVKLEWEKLKIPFKIEVKI